MIYQMERLPLMPAILIHGSVLYVSYFLIWMIIYSIIKRNTEKINILLKQKQQNTDEK